MLPHPVPWVLLHAFCLTYNISPRHCVYGTRPVSVHPQDSLGVHSVSECWRPELGQDTPSSHLASAGTRVRYHHYIVLAMTALPACSRCILYSLYLQLTELTTPCIMFVHYICLNTMYPIS